ncbi:MULTISPECIES: hypothetical protein [Psychrobacter]|uniref:hypothetical protein n=1 Tax=Psychrobacter TaxID=497 RepID=UPI00191AD5C8|nr:MULTISPECIES: hypothetical protein [Psychrobacter]
MKRNIKMVLFSGLFVVIATLLSEFLIPKSSSLTTPIIAALSVLIVWPLAKKLFPNKS